MAEHTYNRKPTWLRYLILIQLMLWISGYAGAGQITPVDRQSINNLPDINELPDPFLMNDGTRVKTKADWAKRREEIKEIILYYQYGHIPPPPGNVTAKELSSKSVYNGAATRKHILLSMGPGEQIKANVGLIIPEGKGPFPVILKNDLFTLDFPIAEKIIKYGYILAGYNCTDFDPDARNIIGPAQAAYPDYDWATLAVWAWGGMRVVDYLLTLDVVDKEKIIITGHSRGGKAALLAGALDERIALVVPNGSGCGGAASYRFQGKDSERLANITSAFRYWFQPRLRYFSNKETKLPFDQHFLMALVAPRALISTNGLDDLWTNPYGTQQTHLGAKPVFKFLGVPDKLGIHFRPGGHAQNDEDWRALIHFADKILFGKKQVDENRFDRLPFPNAPKPFSWSIPKN
jgi:pimeloyl-ACP methyl ester carboxylesterase